MKVYAQFLTKNLRGETVDALGSDGYIPLDGRNKVQKWMRQALERGMMLNKNLGKGYVGAEIRRGNLRCWTNVCRVTF